MSLIEKFLGIAFTLTFTILLLKNANAFNSVVNGLAGGFRTVDTTLQGN